MSTRKRPHDKPDFGTRKSKKRRKRNKRLRKLLAKAGNVVRVDYITRILGLKILLDLWVNYRVALPDEALAVVMTVAIVSFLLTLGDSGKLLVIAKGLIDLFRQ